MRLSEVQLLGSLFSYPFRFLANAANCASIDILRRESLADDKCVASTNMAVQRQELWDMDSSSDRLACGHTHGGLKMRRNDGPRDDNAPNHITCLALRWVAGWSPRA
ncbi:hypothetical protein PHISCL_08451 [Aspergillus sclerotialis]|uniref:Uncharacterized protein n=1 Tax=Aspergillus sclerotialis TaxID=2070753 RepID=A0A3A2ZQ43_9EURO|nr:hypothetical protein PHISCL_08451 [Aspergillus sclerotialis]